MNQQVESDKLLKILCRRKLPRFENMPEVCEFVSNFMVKHYDLYGRNHINRGYCFIWAYLVWALSNEEVKFFTTDGHVVVECDGTFYDASMTYGSIHLEDLDIDPDDGSSVNVRGMAWYWTRCGVAKKEFRRILRHTCNKIYNKVRVGGFGDNRRFYSDELCVDDIP